MTSRTTVALHGQMAMQTVYTDMAVKQGLNPDTVTDAVQIIKISLFALPVFRNLNFDFLIGMVIVYFDCVPSGIANGRAFARAYAPPVAFMC